MRSVERIHCIALHLFSLFVVSFRKALRRNKIYFLVLCCVIQLRSYAMDDFVMNLFRVPTATADQSDSDRVYSLNVTRQNIFVQTFIRSEWYLTSRDCVSIKGQRKQGEVPRILYRFFFCLTCYVLVSRKWRKWFCMQSGLNWVKYKKAFGPLRSVIRFRLRLWQQYWC